MRIRLLKSIGASVVIAASLVIANRVTIASAEAPALKTAWGEPDLQGIWTVESDTPLQRSPKFANQEFFTAAQREALAFAKGRGPNPAIKDNAADFVGVEQDPLQ